MTQTIGTFDFAKFKVTLGSTPIEGFADGEAVSVVEMNDAFNVGEGADGYIDRVRNKANRLEITITLRQTTPTNDLLSAIHRADRLASTPLPLLIKDNNGTTVIAAPVAWIRKYADIVNGNEANTRIWTIDTGSDYDINVGSNS